MTAGRADSCFLANDPARVTMCPVTWGLDVLINNAGGCWAARLWQISADLAEGTGGP